MGRLSRRPSRVSFFGALTSLLLFVIALAVPNESQAQRQRPPITPIQRLTAGFAKPFNLTVAPAAPIASCPPPTLAQCKDINYLVSGCGQAHQKTCQGLLKPAYEAYWNALPGQANRPMFSPGKPTLFSNLKSGKFHAAAPTKPVTKRIGAFFDQNRTSVSALLDPKSAAVHPTWEANGPTMESCEEYAYEKYYDWSRFEDGVRLCRGDNQCVFDVAYVPNGPPGIVNRPLKRKDGKVMPDQPKPGFPNAKNIFFAHAAGFLGVTYLGQLSPFLPQIPAAIGFDELKAKFPQYAKDFDDFKKILEDGANFYGPKAKPGTNEVFDNPWTFHSTLRNRTKLVSDNEFEEFDRRKKEFEMLLFAAIAPPAQDIPVAVNQFLPPGTEVEFIYGPDPFARLDTYRDVTARTNKALNYARSGLAIPGLTGAAAVPPGGSPINVQGGARFLVPPSGGVLAKPAAGGVAPQTNVGPTSSTSTVVATLVPPQIPCPEPKLKNYNEGAQIGMSKGDVDKSNQTMLAKHASCKLTNLTLQEMWRYKKAKEQGGCNERGSCGCLDLSSYACDWSPQAFYDAYAKVPPGSIGYNRETEYKFCKRWAWMGFPGMPATAKQSPEALEKYLKDERDKLLKTLKSIPQKKNAQGVTTGVLGEDFGDEAIEGDEDGWSAGYKFDMGWEVKANEYLTVNGQKRPCSLEGNARAGFWVKMTTPIDGALPASISNVWRRAVDADAWVRVNENKNKEVRYETHLVIANYEIFAEPAGYVQNGYKTYNPNDTQTFKSFPLNHAYSAPLVNDVIPSPKLTLTVMAGPVPITGAVWVELSYGADFIARAGVPDKCTPDLKLYEAKVGFEPYFGLDGAISLGVGIGGILSAGIMGAINLITIRLPLAAATWLSVGQNNTMDLQFGVTADMLLSTLSGRLSLYVEFLFWSEEFELVSWDGLGPYKIPLLTIVSEKIPLFSLAALAP